MDAPEHTGGMIALVPANPNQLAVDGGDPVDELHLTLAYLGDDVSSLSDDERSTILDAARGLAASTAPVQAEVMGHAAFNPTGAHGFEPCAVCLVTGDALPGIKASVADLDKSEHPVFLPHITAGYGLAPDQLSFVGPVIFDRLRVALADDVHDFPLAGAQEEPVPNTLTADATIEPAGPPVNGEIPIRLPVLVLEAVDTSDGRYLAEGSLSHRALPLSLLAQPESMHGGNDAGPAGVVGRIDTLTRTPGPEVTSPRTGQPFPEGTFVWSGTGTLMADAKVGIYNVAELFRRGYLRGISVDLAGMDYEVLGDDGSPIDPDNPRRQVVTHHAEIAAATLVPIPAFGDAYAVPADDEAAFTPVAPADLPAGLCASAFPAWRSVELGDRSGLVAAGLADDGGITITVPPNAAADLAAVIDTGQQRDADALAAAILDHIATQWATDSEASKVDDLDPNAEPAPLTAAGPDNSDDAGDPAAPQPCELGPEPAIISLVFRDGDAYAATCAKHEQDVRDQLAANGETIVDEVPINDASAADAEKMADQPLELPADTPPQETGMPDGPQDCLLGADGPHPATMSLIFDGGQQYLACCDLHQPDAEAMITGEGFEIEQAVPIAAEPTSADTNTVEIPA